MKGVIIAAGPSTRLLPLTEHVPKCMLKAVGDKTLLQTTVDHFRDNGIDDISVIRGYKKEKINITDVEYFDNDNFLENNILHSLMYARSKLEEALKNKEEIVISYADIWFAGPVLKALLESSNDVAVVVDRDWEEYYKGRTDHPISEAENVITNKDGRIVKIGKHIFTKDTNKNRQGEFIGLFKLTSHGIEIFLKHFDRLDTVLGLHDPYQNTKEWQKSYLTDFFQEMIDHGVGIFPVTISGDWKEFDTVQDFERSNGRMSKV